MESKGAISSFWGDVIPPKKSIFVDFPPETCLKITSFAFGKIESNEPSKITANVNTLLIEDEDSIHGDECDAFKHGQTVLGTLTPNKEEQIQVNIQFTPLDIIEIHNSGSNEVHISGFLEPIDNDYSDEEEEEASQAEEVIENPDTIQERFSKMALNQPPKPVIQKKKKNKKEKKNDSDNGNDENEDEGNENEDDHNENEE